MAERLLLGDEQLPVHHYIDQVSHFPPLFPLLLAGAQIGSQDFVAAHWLQCSLIVLSGIACALYAWTLAKSWLITTLALTIFLVSPATLLLSVEIWSEFLFIVLVYIGLSLVGKDKASNLEFIFACLLIGLSAITRGFGLFAVAAVLIHTTVKNPRRLLPALLSGLLPLGLSSLAGWGGNRSYFEIFSARVTDIEALKSVLTENAQAIWRAWIYLFDRTPDFFSIAVCLLVVLFAALSFFRRLRTLEIDSLFCGAYLALLLIWPFPAVMERLLVPLAPLLIIYALIFLLPRGVKSPEQLPIQRVNKAAAYIATGCGFILLFMAISTSAILLKHHLEPLPDPMRYLAASRNWMNITDRDVARHRIENAHSILSGLKRAATEIPVGDCVYSQRPQIAMLYTLRPSFPSTRRTSPQSAPRCRFHLLVNDGSMQRGLDAMWPNYQVVFAEKNAGTTSVILARYVN